MNVVRFFLALAVLLLASVFLIAPASAQAPRTWVSGVGDDVNPCSRTAPCKTFAGAISKTAAGGEINCIDPGGFGAVTITKAITIACEDVEAGVSNSSTNGVIINAAAADIIVLRGLDIDSASATPGLNGIRFLAGAALHVEDCVIRSNTGAAPNGAGILFSPSGTAELYVHNSTINGNNDGVRVQPTGAGVAKVMIDSSAIENNNLAGLKADGTSNTGGSNTTIANSSVSGNTNAGISIFNPVGGPAINIMVDSVAVANNGAAGGLRVDGANATVRVGRSTISGNALGTAIVNGGVISSYGNNQLNGNTSDGPNPPTIPLK
ncbi:right-handed parallel beta-helix repeat-containing protein [Mesorhizobium sp.]|uniref:right-handed parallel beta-helix repeat-containing protein n=1 Tax=Mesorhizobium sp. TaxID=1871066 RepID=UPI000FE7F026|nr:right-handed parallel beta-helix repeat-containing protein [Mesorhizobium sp.]RWC27779.1 MAG: right-handed parallel beta-helix repeat-containing protein [Mesorhizobium sp.]TIX26967.1 MAG: right-handed parallel beta-helix repeat-containing protein [Mesorhizobium sp.]